MVTAVLTDGHTVVSIEIDVDWLQLGVQVGHRLESINVRRTDNTSVEVSQDIFALLATALSPDAHTLRDFSTLWTLLERETEKQVNVQASKQMHQALEQMHRLFDSIHTELVS